jgi:zinc finger SWIM domain-containing protein 3
VQKSYVEWDENNQEIILRKLSCSREASREAKYMKRDDRKRRPRISLVLGVEPNLSLQDSMKQVGGL